MASGIGGLLAPGQALAWLGAFYFLSGGQRVNFGVEINSFQAEGTAVITLFPFL